MGKEKKKLETPEYFHMETFRREEYLAQIGSFTQVQYQLFHNICDFWQPALDYNHFILKSSKSALASNNQLELLMEKLKAAHMGLLCYAQVEGLLKPSKIVLTEKDSPLFFYFMAEDILARQIDDKNNPYMTAQAYDNEGIALPDDLIVPLDNTMLSPGYDGDEHIIIGIPRKMKSPLLIPSGMIPEYVASLIAHVRSEMTSPNLMENISRITEQKISDIQKKLTSREPAFWLHFCRNLLESKEDLKIRLKGLNPMLFTSAQLLQNYFQNSMNEINRKNTEQKEKMESTENIIREYKEAGANWSPISVLDSKLREAEERWEGYTDEFKKAALLRGENKEQPRLVVLNHQVIHKDHLFQYFTREIAKVRNDLLFLYQDQMSDLLRHNKTDRYTQFFSRSNFRADIMERLKDRDLQLWTLLQKSTKVAESGYHYLQNVKGMKNNTRIKEALGLYFKTDLKSFRNIDTLLQLKLLSLFEKSYKELGWWSHFVLRLTGRYDSYINMFSDVPPDKKRASRSSRSSKRRKRNREIPEIQDRPVHRRRSPGPSTPQYTPKDKRRAWAEFDEAIHKSK